MRKSRLVGIVRAVAGLIAASVCIVASAATPFDGMSGQLEHIASCDISMFPVNRRGEVILAGFVKDLAGAGVRSRHTGTPPEDQTTYTLPRAIKVFGQPVTKIDDLNPPFVKIEFDLSADELTAAINRTTGETFIKNLGLYELITKKRFLVAGEKYMNYCDCCTVGVQERAS
ncbi:hypothetical protein ACH51_19610 (plasmid) [Ralstonia solanacearum]|nr:hypothetical protein ACH51_19610 [Ralstonia solanacearum]